MSPISERVSHTKLPGRSADTPSQVSKVTCYMAFSLAGPWVCDIFPSFFFNGLRLHLSQAIDLLPLLSVVDKKTWFMLENNSQHKNQS